MPDDPYPKSRRIREAMRKARKITSMLQGTMGLEGQGLPSNVLRRMTRQTTRELIEKWERETNKHE